MEEKATESVRTLRSVQRFQNGEHLSAMIQIKEVKKKPTEGRNKETAPEKKSLEVNITH